MSEREHIPVLLEEVLRFLAPRPGDVILDGTVGAGGHSERILEGIGQDGFLVGTDQDENILPVAKATLDKISGRYKLLNINYRKAIGELKKLQAEFPGDAERLVAFDGILLDLGVSSVQLDNYQRGFSFLEDGPLDMRMNRAQKVTAARLVNTLPEQELARIIKEYGEERFAKAIARRIVVEREKAPIEKTGRLVEIVRGCMRGRSKIHPATRTFQALRIAVNDELGALEEFLRRFIVWLKPGGRAVVISFHSLEDRLVKHRFRELAKSGEFELLTKKPIIASEDEKRNNPRSRSAKLRAIYKKTVE